MNEPYTTDEAATSAAVYKQQEEEEDAPWVATMDVKRYNNFVLLASIYPI